MKKIFVERDIKTIEKVYAHLNDKERQSLMFYKNLKKWEPEHFNKLQELAQTCKKSYSKD